jgi:hypothetical protein
MQRMAQYPSAGSAGPYSSAGIAGLAALALASLVAPLPWLLAALTLCTVLQRYFKW